MNIIPLINILNNLNEITVPTRDSYEHIYQRPLNIHNIKDLIQRLDDFQYRSAIDSHLTDNMNILEAETNYREGMPMYYPEIFSSYKQLCPNHDEDLLTKTINDINCILSEGQIVFHAGSWSNFHNPTHRALSTSLNPIAAINIATFNSQLPDNNTFTQNSFDLLVLTARNPQTKVYIYDRNDRNEGPRVEEEILFAAGANINLTSGFTLMEKFQVFGSSKNSYEGLPGVAYDNHNGAPFRYLPFRIYFGTIS